MNGLQMSGKNGDFIHEIGRHGLLQLQTKEVFDLRAENENGDAAGEAHRHRIRNILNHRSQAG